MKKGLYIFLGVISLAYLSIMYFMGKNSSKENILGATLTVTTTPISTPEATATATPTPTPTETPTPTPTPTPTKTKSPTPSATSTSTPLPKPSSATSEEINAFINRFAIQYGVDPNILRHIAICESGFRSNAASAGYVGLYQFGSTTWKNIRAEIGEDRNPDLRYSAEESVQTAAYVLSKQRGGIWPNCQP